MSYARIATIVAVLALAFGAGWISQGWRADKALSSLQAEHALEVAEAESATRVAQQLLDEERDKWNDERSRIDYEQTAKLKVAEDETNRLRDCIANGTCGLRINAKCPTPATDVPEAGAPGRMDHGTGPELTADARQNYFALRDGIAKVVAQLAACQGSTK